VRGVLAVTVRPNLPTRTAEHSGARSSWHGGAARRSIRPTAAWNFRPPNGSANERSSSATEEPSHHIRAEKSLEAF
jgi:hypothetical protein